MMILTLIPQIGRPRADLTVAGDVLTVAGVPYDFGALAEGAIHAALIWHCGDETPPGGLWVVPAGDGPVPLPGLPREVP